MGPELFGRGQALLTATGSSTVAWWLARGDHSRGWLMVMSFEDDKGQR